MEDESRAVWVALFVVAGLVMGAFIIGYGAGILGSPAPAPTAVGGGLPPLATPEPGSILPGAGTVDGSRGAAAEATLTPREETGSVTSGSPTPHPGIGGQQDDGGLVTTLDNLDVNTSSGGVEILILMRNNSSQPVSFSFSPSTDLSLTDSQGRRYDLRWAEFSGVVKVSPGESVQLVRAFYGGLPAEDAQYLEVGVGHPPQLARNSWQVPLSR